MKVICKTNEGNNLTKDKIYVVQKGSWKDGRFFIRDDFQNEQWYSCNHFYTLDEMRDEKIDDILDESDSLEI